MTYHDPQHYVWFAVRHEDGFERAGHAVHRYHVPAGARIISADEASRINAEAAAREPKATSAAPAALTDMNPLIERISALEAQVRQLSEPATTSPMHPDVVASLEALHNRISSLESAEPVVFQAPAVEAATVATVDLSEVHSRLDHLEAAVARQDQLINDVVSESEKTLKGDA